MIKNFQPITTLIRNKISGKKIDSAFLEHKGVSIKIEDENLFSLKNGGMTKSEISKVCQQGLIYRGPHLVCFKGEKIRNYTLHQAKDLKWFIWDKNTVFIEYIEGKTVFMYWDPQLSDWSFSDYKEPKSDTYYEIFNHRIYNIMNYEPSYTYVFKILGNAKSKKSPIILEEIIDTKKGKNIGWDKIDKYAGLMNVTPIKFFKFEGFDTLEENDFPIYVQDKSQNKIFLRSLK